jgi:hypothetical protein
MIAIAAAGFYSGVLQSFKDTADHFFSNKYFKLRLLFAVAHFAMTSAGNCLLIMYNNEQLPALRCDSRRWRDHHPCFAVCSY